MIPLQFPTRRIEPIEDVTERGLHAVIDIATDFQIAIVQAERVSRVIQLRQRIAVCLALLTDAENAALAKMDRVED